MYTPPLCEVRNRQCLCGSGGHDMRVTRVIAGDGRCAESELGQGREGASRGRGAAARRLDQVETVKRLQLSC